MNTTSNNKKAGILEGKISFSVYYEDTDFSGYVYHANYLKFFERAREHLLGIEYFKTLKDKGILFVVTHMDVRFLSPAKHGDLVEVVSSCVFSKSPIIKYTQRAFVDGRELVRAEIETAAVNSINRPVRIPQFLLDYLNQRAGENPYPG